MLQVFPHAGDPGTAGSASVNPLRAVKAQIQQDNDQKN